MLAIWCSSTIVIYAHEPYDKPVIDAMNLFWPSKPAKLVIKEKISNMYTMELEKNLVQETNEAPCNMESGYSYSKEGRTDKLDITLNFYLVLTKAVL